MDRYDWHDNRQFDEMTPEDKKIYRFVRSVGYSDYLSKNEYFCDVCGCLSITYLTFFVEDYRPYRISDSMTLCQYCAIPFDKT